tara:strand:+ start:65 stop:265 length:201 start_codon:yes stop_codon:yes gene_type:complete
MNNTYTFTDDELLCLQVCLQNAPTPYHISKKKIVSVLEDKIGKPPKVIHEPLSMPKYDLTKYGIHD